MKRILTLGACALAISALSVGASAQQPGTGTKSPAGKTQPGNLKRGDHKTRVDWFKHLNLTPDQKAKITKILEDQRAHMKALRGGNAKVKGNPPNKEQLAKMKSLKDETHNKIRSVLTPAQQKQWDEMRKKRIGKVKGDGKV
jgi:Spy/CpxP family protein refolding chaperone